MRINLKTPFAEKDAARALGARWDAARKIWYITDVADLTPFMRWIPDLLAAGENAATPTTGPAEASAKPAARASAGVITKPTVTLPHCGCATLPWLDCPHTVPAAA